MIRLKETRETRRPIAEVFTYVANFATTADYDPGVKSAHREDEGPVQEGSRFHVDAVFMGKVIPLKYHIERFESPHRVVLRGVGEASRALDDICFEETEYGGTRITWTLDLEMKGGKLIELIFGPIMRRVGRAALDGLAKRLASTEPLSSD
ncbi:MAG: SRPBCC family protein [Planctomycetota bacterium]|nr:SRPBCC family protein [Planctomycetota bacterium]